MRPLDPPISSTRNWYIITKIDYTTKWLEAKTLKDNTAKSTTKILYEKIIIYYDCLIKLINDQNIHFIDEIIQLIKT